MIRLQTRMIPKAVAVLGLAGLAAGCAGSTMPETAMTPGQRFPITVTETRAELPVPVTPSTTTLRRETKSAVANFIQAWREQGHGSLHVAVPSGGENALAAVDAATEVDRVLRAEKVPPEAVSHAAYRVAEGTRDAPIVLSFTRYTASTRPCGNFPKNMGRAFDNGSTANFGCANRANIAAMLEDPYDLIEPRGQAPADAARRATVLELYRQGGVTGAERSDDEDAAVSDIAE